MRVMTARDAEAAASLFGLLMEELKGYVPDHLREGYRRMHDADGIREMLRDRRSVMLVACDGEAIAGFLLGRAEGGMGTIHCFWASNQARASCAGVACFAAPIRSSTSTTTRLARIASGVKRGLRLRMSELSKVALSSILPVR